MKKSIITTTLLFVFVFCNSYSQTAKTYTLQELQARFKHEKYTEKVLLDFQKTMLDLRQKPQLNEEIPGEIISWYTMNGEFSWHKTYLVKNDKVTEVETLPKDEKFLTRLNSFVPEKSKFSYSHGLWSFAFVEKKLDDNYYLITATAKSFNSHPDIPNDDILIYDMEYKTKDFKEFILVRLKDTNSTNWIEVDKN